MDLKMRSYTNANKEKIWDFCIDETTGTFEILPTEQAEEFQRAVVAAFTQLNSIPQLPDVGVQWAELVTETVGANEISTQVIQAIQNNAETFAYLPVYSKENNKLVVTIKEVGK